MKECNRREFLGLAAGMGLLQISEAQYTPGAGLKAKREKVIIDRVETIKVDDSVKSFYTKE